MTDVKKEGAVLVNVSDGGGPEKALGELEALTCTLGYEVRAYMTQRRAHPDKSYFIGSGKLDELKSVVEATDSCVVIFENEVSGTQLNNLEKYLGVTVMDRSTLIIEIFARHATTNEGKLQVELMRKKKLLPRVLGRSLERRLKKLSSERAVRRERRIKNAVKVVSLVGYTNAGKSSLMNALTNAGVGVEDKLFATLDPVVRRMRLAGGEVLLVDTVGFISNLPHGFVEAFRSTLEETKFSDLLLHVVDSSDPDSAEQYEVVNEVLKEIGADEIPVITVLNKCDRLPDDPVVPASVNVVRTSATLKLGLDDLKDMISRMLGSCDGSSRHKK